MPFGQTHSNGSFGRLIKNKNRTFQLKCFNFFCLILLLEDYYRNAASWFVDYFRRPVAVWCLLVSSNFQILIAFQHHYVCSCLPSLMKNKIFLKKIDTSAPYFNCFESLKGSKSSTRSSRIEVAYVMSQTQVIT